MVTQFLLLWIDIIGQFLRKVDVVFMRTILSILAAMVYFIIGIQSQDDRELCPTGWWVPTDNDWSILIDFLGGTQVAGGKIKLTGTDYWEEPNKGATNESGFNALPGGFRSEHGGFYPLGNTGMWWSSTEDEFGEVWFFDSSTGTTNLTKGSFSPNGKKYRNFCSVC